MLSVSHVYGIDESHDVEPRQSVADAVFFSLTSNQAYYYYIIVSQNPNKQPN